MLLLVVLSIAIYTELLLFFYFETELLGHIGSLFNQKPEKFGWCHNLFDTFATYASLVYDVTNADCLAQDGSTHGRAFATFSRRFLTRGTRNGGVGGGVYV